MSEPAQAGWAEIGWVAAHRQTNWEKGGEGGGWRGVLVRVRKRWGMQEGGGASKMTTGGLGGR